LSSEKSIGPPTTVSIGCSLAVIEVTTPKFPPPPRSPVELLVLALVGGDYAAVREHDLGAEDVVDREAGLAGQVPDPAAQHQPARACRRDDPAGRRQAVGVRRRVDVSEQRAAGDLDGAVGWVDLDAPERGEVDHQAAVHASQAGAVVAPAADREVEPVLAAVVHRGDDVVDVRNARDQRGTSVDHRVVERTDVVVVGVARPGDVAVQSRSQRVDAPGVEPGVGQCLLLSNVLADRTAA
jgi:hypothetical protein